MGLLDKARSVVSGSKDDSGTDEIDEIIDEVEEDMVEEEEDDFVEDEIEQIEEEEPEQDEDMEWETAYDFATEFLEPRGFSSGKDFAAKAMMHEIEKSPLYRDRIDSGVRTINQITSATEQLQQVRGGGDDMDLEGMATKIESANKVISQMETLEGKEDKMYQEIMGLGHKLAESVVSRQAAGSAVNAEVREHDEEL
jgi:hypothetical protein